MAFALRPDRCRSFPIDHAGAGGCTPGSFGYTLSGVTYLVDGTLYRPPDFFSPDGLAGRALMQTWAGGGSSIGSTGGGGGAAYSERTALIGATEVVTVAPTPAAGASGGNSSVGVLCLAEGGQSPSGPQPGQGGQASAGIGDITRSGGNGSQGTGNRDGGGSAGRNSNGGTPTAGSPNGSYSHLPGAAPGWPGAGAGSTSSGLQGRPGLVRVSYLVPSLPNAPRIVSLTEFRDDASTLSRSCTPGVLEAGDLMVLYVSSSSATGVIPVITAPTWADGLLTAQTNAANTVTERVLYRTATGTAADDATILTSTSQQASGHMFVLRGNSGPPEWTTGAADVGNVVLPLHTNSFGYAPTLCIAACALVANNGGLFTALLSTFEGTIVTPSATNVSAASRGVSALSCWRQFNGFDVNPGSYANVSGPWVSGTITIPGTV